jgi:hypothetical protein
MTDDITPNSDNAEPASVDKDNVSAPIDILPPARQLARQPATREVLMPMNCEQVVQGMRAYQQLLHDLLEASDWQPADGKRFLKKSGWRKIARAFNLSFERVHDHVERDVAGNPTRAEAIYRAIAPNGQYGDGDGYCSADEPRFRQTRGRQKLENDLRATATTRAKNRATADLVGMGEVSAEEATDVDAGGAAHGPELDSRQRGDVAAAIDYLVGDHAKAMRAAKTIREQHGYMPQAVGRAILELAHARRALESAQAGESSGERAQDEPDTRQEEAERVAVEIPDGRERETGEHDAATTPGDDTSDEVTAPGGDIPPEGVLRQDPGGAANGEEISHSAQLSDAVRQMIAAAHATGVPGKTLNRFAVLLAARRPDTVLKLEELDDKLAAELARRVVQAHNAGWDNDTLADMVEQALRSERHRTPAQRRKAFRDHLDRLATEAQIRAQQEAGPEAA